MNFVNFVLDHYILNLPNSSVGLFRLSASDIQSNEPEAIFSIIYQFKATFSLHLLVDDSIVDEAKFALVLERVFLIVGRENYCSILQKKIIFISINKSNDSIAARLIFKLRSFTSKIYIVPVRYGSSDEFISSLNVCVKTNPEDMMHHFQAYISRLISQKMLFAHNFNYFIISQEPIKINQFNQLLVAQLKTASDMLSLMNESATEMGEYKEIIDSIRKENVSLLNAVSFLKKEVRNQYEEKEGVHKSAHRSEQLAISKINNRVEEIRIKYYYEYEVLPVIYKKIGAMLKILSGKKEISYYLSKKQKQNFFDLLQSLPRDKQIEMWYHYEYEILPEWYKNFAKIFLQKKLKYNKS